MEEAGLDCAGTVETEGYLLEQRKHLRFQAGVWCDPGGTELPAEDISNGLILYMPHGSLSVF